MSRRIRPIFTPFWPCITVLNGRNISLEIRTGDFVKFEVVKFLMSLYLKGNRLMRWCSSPECTYAMKADQTLMKKAECVCGKVICFKCGRDWHDPMQCHLLDKWMLKYTTDSENAQYIVANTKVPLSAFFPFVSLAC